MTVTQFQPPVPRVVAALRRSFDSGRTKPVSWRVSQLRALRSMLIEHSPEIEQALRSDLGKAPAESFVTETRVVLGEIDGTLRHLTTWLRPKRVSVPLMVAPASAAVVREPLGVVLIIAPWNYPVQLLLAPMVGALAAGNAVVLKPSELAPSTSHVLATLIGQYLDPAAVAVVEGGVDETTELLAQRLDHVFYTGSARVGRLVLKASVEHLTPVTLELGGKSPVFVDDDVDLAAAAKRIAWGKFMNAGQTCVAPDYLMATPAVLDRLLPLLARAIRDLYGDDVAASPDYGRIVNDDRFARLSELLASGRVAIGGETDATSRFIAPSILTGVGVDDPVMQEEIFGPLLPLLAVASVDEAIAQIRAGDKPLALYVFSESKTVRRRFVTETSSGALAFGAPSAHLAVPGLPFGGVGESGMGSYHGERSLVVFSHEKAVLSKPLRPDTLAVAYPPFGGDLRRSLLAKVLRRLP